MSYRNYGGYCLGISGIHVCGYLGDKVIIQDNRNGLSKPRKYQLLTNGKGTYFNLKGKRVYVEKIEKEIVS